MAHSSQDWRTPTRTKTQDHDNGARITPSRDNAPPVGVIVGVINKYYLPVEEPGNRSQTRHQRAPSMYTFMKESSMCKFSATGIRGLLPLAVLRHMTTFWRVARFFCCPRRGASQHNFGRRRASIRPASDGGGGGNCCDRSSPVWQRAAGMFIKYFAAVFDTP